MAKRISQQDIAHAAGVSRSAVSHFLNGRLQFLSSAVQERIAQACKTLDYVPISAPMRMRGQKNEIVTLVLPFLSGLMLTAKVEALVNELDRRGFSVQVKFHYGSKEKLSAAILSCIEEQVESLIFFPGYLPVEHAYEELARAKRHGTHVLLADMLEETPLKVDRVVIDRPAGALASLEHLYDLGHREIGAVFRLESASIEDNFRYAAYQDFMNSHDLTINPHWILSIPIEEPAYQGSFVPTLKHLRTLKRKRQLPTAFLGNNDEIAIAIINALAELKLSVPGDASVMGYNDDRVAALYRPALTTIRQPAPELASAVADLIERRRKTPKAKPIFHSLTPELIIRESTAPLLPH
ncbi:MAG: LacI family DNA-binding transcriptional regulator [Planctomycetota bacterium]